MTRTRIQRSPKVRTPARDLARIAKRTIAEVLAEFLRDQRKRLAAWMGEKGYAEAEEAEDAAGRGSAGASPGWSAACAGSGGWSRPGTCTRRGRDGQWVRRLRVKNAFTQPP
jgi:hypothetical protein